MGHRCFCDSRFWRLTWLPSAVDQEVGCLLFVYRIATRRDCNDDPYAWSGRFGHRSQSLRNFYDDSDASSSGSVFDLVFEAHRKPGLDKLRTIACQLELASKRRTTILAFATLLARVASAP